MTTRCYITAAELLPLLGQWVELVTRQNVYAGVLHRLNGSGEAHSVRAVLLGGGYGKRFPKKARGRSGWQDRERVAPALNQIVAVYAFDAGRNMMSARKEWPKR